MTYANPGQPYAAPARRGKGMAVAALVLGILALISSFTVIGGILFGLLAVILGIIGSRRAGRGEADGRGMAIAGIVTGAIGLLLAVILIAVGVSILNSSSVKNLQACINKAGGNQAAIQSCDQQFDHQFNGG